VTIVESNSLEAPQKFKIVKAVCSSVAESVKMPLRELKITLKQYGLLIIKMANKYIIGNLLFKITIINVLFVVGMKMKIY